MQGSAPHTTQPYTGLSPTAQPHTGLSPTWGQAAHPGTLPPPKVPHCTQPLCCSTSARKGGAMISPSPGFVRAILGFNYYYFLSPSSAFEQCRARRGCGSHHCVGPCCPGKGEILISPAAGAPSRRVPHPQRPAAPIAGQRSAFWGGPGAQQPPPETHRPLCLCPPLSWCSYSLAAGPYPKPLPCLPRDGSNVPTAVCHPP